MTLVVCMVCGVLLVAEPGDGGTAPAGDLELPPVQVPLSRQAVDGGTERAGSPRDPLDPTAEVTSLDTATFQDQVRSTAELLATAPGATVHRAGDLGQYATLSLRGSTSDEVLILMDGLPLTSAVGGTVDLSTLPVGLIERLDVLRGNAAAIYGASALGGVVNVVTKRPGPEDATANLSVGSWNTLSAAASDGVAQGPWSASASASFFRSDGDFSYQYNPTPDLKVAPQTLTRRNDQSLTAGALANAKLSLGSDSLEALAQGTFIDRGLAGTEYLPTPNDHLGEGRGLVGLKWLVAQPLGPSVPIALELSGQGRLDQLDVSLLLPGSAHQLDLEGGAQAALVGHLPHQRLWLLLVGGDEALRSQQGDVSRGFGAVALSDQLSFLGGRILVAPAVRLDQVGAFQGVSPQVGLSVFPLPALELRANTGQGFRAPSFGELYLQQGIALPNPALQPETNRSVDLSAILTWGTLQLSATGFLSAYQNLILYEVLPPLAAKPFNEGQAVVQGVEATLTVRPWPWLTALASFTALDAYDNDPGSLTYGRELPDRPNQTGHAQLAFQRGWLRLSADVDGAAGQFLNRAQTLSIPGHATFDAAAGVRLWTRPDLWLSAEAKNLTNVQVPDNFGYPLPGTSFFVSLSVAQTAPTPSHP